MGKLCIALLLMLVFVTGCQTMSLESIAPPAPLAAGGQLQSRLARGRELYVTKCAKCHSPEPVRKYSVDDWHQIMPEMIDETNLSESDGQAVMAYVLSLVGNPSPAMR